MTRRALSAKAPLLLTLLTSALLLPARASAQTVNLIHAVAGGAADHTGDGRAEIEWWNNTSGEVWLWTIDGTTLSAETWVGTVPDTNYRIAGNGDYDGDGKADFLWHNISVGDVWIWLMDGAVKRADVYVTTVPDTNYRIVR